MPLTISHLYKSFFGDNGKEPLAALKDINLTLKEGEFVCVVGPSGCGKTTLLQILAGLIPPSQGKIELDGEIIDRPTRRVGLVFQEFALFPWRTVQENIEFGLELAGVPKTERRRRAAEYVEIIELKGFEKSYPRELSGGMKQRVAIARTMINDPQVLLMDEPFSSVDSQTRNNLQEFLLKIQQNARKTVVFVTHNIDEAVFLGERVVGLSARPASIKEIFPIALSYPRVRTHPDFIAHRARILEFINRERNNM